MKYTDIKAMNWSSLKNMDVSAKMFQWRVDHPRPDAAHLSLGTAIHCAILEPKRYAIESIDFDSKHITRPDGLDLRTKAGKAWKASLDEGINVLSQSENEALTKERETVARCRKSVMSNKLAHELIQVATVEVVLEWTDADTGVHCKGRADALKKDTLIELKTCRNLARFERDSAAYMYHCQLAFYRDGAVAAGKISADARVYIIAVETTECYDCAVYRVPPDVLEVGRNEYKWLLGYWKECHEADTWPGQAEGLQTLELPAWAMGGEL